MNCFSKGWKEIDPNLKHDINDSDFVDAYDGWVFTLDRTFLRTNNGSNAKLTAPDLLSPENNASDINSAVTLIRRNHRLASCYHLIVRTEQSIEVNNDSIMNTAAAEWRYNIRSYPRSK